MKRGITAYIDDSIAEKEKLPASYRMSSATLYTNILEDVKSFVKTAYEKYPAVTEKGEKLPLEFSPSDTNKIKFKFAKELLDEVMYHIKEFFSIEHHYDLGSDHLYLYGQNKFHHVYRFLCLDTDPIIKDNESNRYIINNKIKEMIALAWWDLCTRGLPEEELVSGKEEFIRRLGSCYMSGGIRLEDNWNRPVDCPQQTQSFINDNMSTAYYLAILAKMVKEEKNDYFHLPTETTKSEEKGHRVASGIYMQLGEDAPDIQDHILSYFQLLNSEDIRKNCKMAADATYKIGLKADEDREDKELGLSDNYSHHCSKRIF